jgi:peptidoglycan hydrolase FlgJ
MSPIGPVSSSAPPRQPDTPAKVLDAAQQFESLLLGQILRAARESGGGWMGSKDASAECATDYAEQQFATVMAKQGGLGLAAMIAKGLERASK